MSRHYLLNPPTFASFSGGRTSGYLLHEILAANGGMPSDAYVLFANTGKEKPQTLKFVWEVGERWDVEIVWLEYRNEHLPHREGDVKVSDHCARVTYETAHRDGEPFAAVIKERLHLPYPGARYCTKELKLRPFRDWMLSLGYEDWETAIGFRADEAHRANGNASFRGRRTFPLIEADVTEEDVMAFWAKQPFDLELRQDQGNCDLCFLKRRAKIARLITEEPSLADWWIEQEVQMTVRGGMAVFRQDRPSYAEYKDLALTGGPLFDGHLDDELQDCNCTD